MRDPQQQQQQVHTLCLSSAQPACAPVAQHTNKITTSLAPNPCHTSMAGPATSQQHADCSVHAVARVYKQGSASGAGAAPLCNQASKLEQTCTAAVQTAAVHTHRARLLSVSAYVYIQQGPPLLLILAAIASQRSQQEVQKAGTTHTASKQDRPAVLTSAQRMAQRWRRTSAAPAAARRQLTTAALALRLLPPRQQATALTTAGPGPRPPGRCHHRSSSHGPAC
jgi:hypothetical protein